MSVVERTGPGDGPLRPGSDVVPLRAKYDDPDDPAELTVFDDDAPTDVTTTWLTVGVDDAVDLEEMR